MTSAAPGPIPTTWDPLEDPRYAAMATALAIRLGTFTPVGLTKTHLGFPSDVRRVPAKFQASSFDSPRPEEQSRSSGHTFLGQYSPPLGIPPPS